MGQQWRRAAGDYYSNNARVVLDVPRRSRGHLTPQSALLLFYYVLGRHIFNNLVYTPLCFHANQLLIVQNGTTIVEYQIVSFMQVCP